MTTPYADLTDVKKTAFKRWMIGLTASLLFPLVTILGLALYSYLTKNVNFAAFFIVYLIAWLVKRLGFRICSKHLDQITEGPLTDPIAHP